MRATLALLMFTLGALTMTTEPAPTQEKKIPDASKKESYDEVVSVRYWDGKKFIIPVEGVKAFRYEKDGVLKFWTKSHSANPGNPGKGSELTDKDGTVWVVERATKTSDFTVCTVKKKPKG